MTLVFLFTFAIGNVWATSYIPETRKDVTSSETIDYATIAGANATTSGKWIVNPRGGTTSSKKYTNVNGDSNGNPDGIVDNIPTITSSVNMPTLNVPSTTKYNQSGKYVIHMRLKGITGLIAHGVTGSSGRGIAIYGQEYTTSLNENTAYGTPLASMTRGNNSGSFILKKDGFSADKEYLITIGAVSGDVQLYAIELIAPSCTKPGTPTSLAAGSVTHNSASLSWTAGANNDGHKIYIEKKSDKTKVLDWTDATSPYAASGLDPETTYTFKVKAKGATGYCELGDEASADFATEADPAATTYKVTLVPAGGTISDATGWTLNAGNYEKEVSDGTELTLPTFTKDNRTFKTWRKAGPTDVTSPITVTADVTLTAVWNATVENVLYSWEGGSPATEVGGTAVTKAQDGTDAETSDINVDAVGTNATYKSIKVQGKISSNAWSGNYIQITTDEAVKTGDKVKITACTTKGDATKKGSAQIRVGTSATGTAIVSDGGTYNDIKVTEDVPVPNTKTFTITAEGINTSTLSMTRQSTNTNCWVTKLQIVREVLVEEANIRTVTFNYNDGGATASTTVEVASGSKVSAPADPTYAHHRFHEWQLGGVAYDFSTAVTSNITLTADWTQLYTVTYAKGEESATGDAPTQDELAASEKFTVAANPFAYEGHDFSTWNDGSADVAPGTEYTMGAANVTLTAQWITATTKVTVTYKDGETTLGSEEITINTGSPVGYATYQTRNLATFDGWYNDPDLAEGHKIADISTLTASADVNVYGKWNYQYASSVNIEQWTLDNGKGVSDAQKETQTGALVSLLGTRKFASNITYDKGNIELDSLNDDPGKTNRNYAYLGLKVKKSGKMLDFRLAKDSYVKVKFGNVAATPKVSINGADYADMELTAGVYSYTATGNDYVSIKTASDGAVVFQQVMINEDIAAVTLPWRVTYDANGGTCATAEAIWSGAALILPDVTPADADHTFAGWYDEATGGELQGVAGASYTPTDNETLFAHFAPVEYAVNYAAGDHGSGDMATANVGWGTEYTAVANGFIPETGYIFAGWAVSGVDGVSSIAAGGSFTMPKNPVTLTALWEDNSKVAVIVETNVKYESLADAVAAATDGQTIQLLQNNNVTAQVEVAEKAITLDLAGYKIEYTGTSTLPSGVILVHNGASLTIDDSSDPDAGSIVSGEKAYAAIALTKAGDDAANPATLVVNGGTLTGHYYGITGNGSRNNTDITINGGTITGTVGIAIYHPQVGTLTVNNGSLTGEDAAIEMRAGTLVINDGTFTATATVFSCDPNGSGSTTSGAAIAIAQHTTKKDIEVTINGGTFNGVKALNESNPQVNDPAPQVTMAVTAGTFTGEVSTVDVHEFISGGTYDAPVASENCAPGYVPSAEVAPGVYTVVPKDGVEIIGVVVTGNTTGTVTGLYKGDASVNLNSKKIDSGKYIYVTLKEGYTFEENDVLIVDVDTKSNLDGGTKALEITTGVGNIDGDVWKSIAFDDYTTGENIISLEGIAAGQTSIGLKRSANQNAKINGLRVLRPMKPMLTAITIDGRDGVIDEANKAVAVTIPHDADLAALTVVPTIAWNEAAASNSIVVNDGSAWIEGANTYKLTDKDNDYTVYTITLTRDVLKHAVKFYDGETLLETVEVEDGTQMAAGDVPADPTKEDYIFQGWAETADGAAVDVTSFTISAAKNFYAKWAADGAIKLINKTSGAVNEDGYFITGVTATEANSEKAAAWGGTQGATISGTNQLNKVVQYNATTNQTKLQIKVYNTNNSDKYVYIHKIIEGKTTEESVETLTATSKTVVESEFYEFNDTKNRSFYLTTNSADVKILQVKVIDDGATPMKQAGEAGYSLNLNKGRVVYYGNSDVTFEGLDLNSASNYSVISSSEFQTTKNFSFSISTPVLLKVTTNTAKYYVSQDPDEDGTTATAVTDAGTAEFNLTTTGTWYLVPSTTSNVKYTNIAFELPKAATPVIETQPATNHTFNPGDMTATVVATVSEGTLHYQWYKKATVGDDEEVGTDAATLTTTTEGTYYVVVTNVLAGHQNTSVTSDEAEFGYRVTNDATLMALSYGTPATAIALEDGVYTYNVELAKGTTDVPALAATATMNGYATVTISNAAEFVSYAATSTVTVKSEDLTVTNVYTVNFTVKHDLPQVDVTESTVWDMNNVSASEINLASMTPSKQNVLLLLANIEGVNNNASFNSQALMFEGQRIGRTENNVKYVSGQYVQFNVTVPGMVSVTFASNGSAQRTILINGKQCSRTTNDGTYIKYDVAVEPGSVEIEDVQGYVRISKIEFKAEYSHNRPGLNPANIGTLCWTNNAILGGATLYELAGKNENNKLVFDEVAENRLEAGKPYIFVPENGNTEIKLYNTDTEAALTSPIQNESGMQGTFEDLSSADGVTLWGYYVISKNHYIYVDSDNVTLKAYRAYVLGLDDLNIVSNGPAPINGAPRRRIVMGAQGEQVATGIDNLEASEKPLKLMIDGQMYILRGEKLFDATGRLVK